jgi:hypothetical protein
VKIVSQTSMELKNQRNSRETPQTFTEEPTCVWPILASVWIAYPSAT